MRSLTLHTVITHKASEYADKRTEDRLELQAASVAIQYKEGGNCSKEPKHARDLTNYRCTADAPAWSPANSLIIRFRRD